MSGWEPRTFTTYEYDDAGLLVGSVSESEPEWARSDVEALIAFIEKSRVGPHGQPMSEATSQAANPDNPDRTIRYEVEAWTDFAARAESKFKESFKAQYGDEANLDEIRFVVKKVEL